MQQPNNRPGIPRENPFATFAIQPGALAYQFSDPRISLETLVQEFRERCQGRAAIVGPHGSGKSTLLAGLMERLESPTRVLSLWRIVHGVDNRLPSTSDVASDKLIVIDGYEQLSWWRRWSIERAAKRTGCELLVTTHRPLRQLPTLYQTAVSRETAHQIVDQLLAGHHEVDHETYHARLDTLWSSESFNLRDALFELYDLFESQR